MNTLPCSSTTDKPAHDPSARQSWRAVLTEIAAKAKEALPESHARIDNAVKLVLAGDVELLPDGTARVGSQTNSDVYYTVNGTCECQDYEHAPSHLCKHRAAARLYRRTLEATAQAALPEADTESSALPAIPRQYLVLIQGKWFVRYAGLLQMAHERGLVSLEAIWIFNDAELSQATAVAVFADGRRFVECGDSSPANVGKKVALHWRRVALTRAKARVLRDALGLDLVAEEELGEGE